MSKSIIKNKFNTYSLGYLSPEMTLQNTKYFLDLYKNSDDGNLLSKKFIETCPLYCNESQKPDSFQLSMQQIDRNKAFYIGYGPHGKRRNNYYRNFKSPRMNYYPKTPLILSDSCELKIKQEDKKEEEKINNMEYMQNFTEMMLNDLWSKTWFIKLFLEKEEKIYGPFSSDKIYSFLKARASTKTNDNEKGNILIIDIVGDVYHQPDSLLISLQSEYEKKIQKEKLFNTVDDISAGP